MRPQYRCKTDLPRAGSCSSIEHNAVSRTEAILSEKNHWGGGRMSQCSQIFRAEYKFPSFVPQQINIRLAKKVTVYTGVYLAILYFTCVRETQMCLWANWP